MGFFGRVGNFLSGYISTKRGSSYEEALKEQALEEELKKPSPAVKAAARERLERLKGAEESVSSKSTISDNDSFSETPKPKKRTL